MIIPKLSGNINLCNFKRLPKFERCGLSLLTATPTVPRLMPHPVDGVVLLLPYFIHSNNSMKRSEALKFVEKVTFLPILAQNP